MNTLKRCVKYPHGVSERAMPLAGGVAPGLARGHAIVADEQQIIQDCLGRVLRSSSIMKGCAMKQVSTVTDGESMMHSIEQYQPDLLVVDPNLSFGGCELVYEARRITPTMRIVVFTATRSAGLLASLSDLGVDGIFLKTDPVALLYEKLPCILQGEQYVAPGVRQRIMSAESNALTPRERQTLTLIIQGKSNRDISARLCISPKTVEKHRSTMMRKLGVHSLIELMVYAVKKGLIEADNEVADNRNDTFVRLTVAGG